VRPHSTCFISDNNNIIDINVIVIQNLSSNVLASIVNMHWDCIVIGIRRVLAKVTTTEFLFTVQYL
jgi:hypothetical protein